MSESNTMKKYLTDADYVREMLIIHPKCHETDIHNARIESIALRLERIDE